MKLGIAVVYFVSENDGKLLDLHLGQIERYTDVPYTIYGSANRLLPQFRQTLEQHPKVKFCDCPTTDFRDTKEVSFYLEHLVRMAIDDGASHIVTLHVDSFPIRAGWATTLANVLSESCVLATTPDEYTACLFFNREFYLTYRPTFFPSKAERSTVEFKKFVEEFAPIVHSGVGYLFKANSEERSWHLLRRSENTQEATNKIYGNLIFHFGGAARMEATSATSPNAARTQSIPLRFTPHIVKAIKTIVPQCILEWIGRRGHFRFLVRSIKQSEKQWLLEDPESYLRSLLDEAQRNPRHTHSSTHQSQQ